MAIAKDTRDLKGEWQIATIPLLVAGLNKDLSPHMLEDEQSPDMLNVTPNAKNLLGMDTGYVSFGDTVTGTPRGVFKYTPSSGAPSYILVTNSSVYKWNNSQTEWQLVSNGTSTTVATQATAGTTNIEVADSTGFTVGELVGVILGDGSQHKSTIGSVPDSTHVTLDDGIPTGRTADVGASVVEGAGLSGSDSYQVDAVNVPFNDTLVFTNNVDQPQEYDGTNVGAVQNLPSAPNFIARTCAVFGNYLLFGWTAEGGTERPWRVRRSDTADTTNWSTGNAGFDDLLDYKHGVLKLMNLGTRCIAYRENAITVGMAINTSDKVLQWVTLVNGEGVISTYGVADVGDHHVVVGNKTVYRYRGGLDTEPVLSPIQTFLLGASGDINPEYQDRVITRYVHEYEEVWICYPTADNDYPNKIARLDLNVGGWFVRELTDHISGLGENEVYNSKTWNDLVGSWLDQNWTWNSRRLLSGAPTIMLCGADTNQVYEYDYLATSDNGVDFTYYVETKDFMSLHESIRVDYLICYMRGLNVTVSYSTDGGETWVPYGTVSPGPTLSVERLTRQVVTDRIRFRWEGTGGPFALGWFGFSYLEESEV